MFHPSFMEFASPVTCMVVSVGADTCSSTFRYLDVRTAERVLCLHSTEVTEVGAKAHSHMGGPNYSKPSASDDNSRIAGSINADPCSPENNPEVNVPPHDEETV